MQEDLDDFFAKTDNFRKGGEGKAPPKEIEFEPEFQTKETGTSRGEELISQLEKIKPGKPDAKNYELICQDIVKYLFGEYLIDARSQARTEDGLNFYDIIYRVNRMKPHPFWEALTRDFRARVVLFECKNYTKPITPIQVFTTERYLSIVALRSICFLLSRKAPQKNAALAASGAMRESGKLLIFLNDKDIKSMLRVRDAQLRDGPDSENWNSNDPTVLLDQKIYEFLSGLPR